MKSFILTCLSIVAIFNFSLTLECGLEGSVIEIVEGKNVTTHKYPWLAHIRSYGSDSSKPISRCVGVLIDAQHIVTAGRCIFENDFETFAASNVDVFLDIESAYVDTPRPKSVLKIWFDRKYSSKYLANDFAILTLSEPVQFTSTISPICLIDSDLTFPNLTMAGWKTFVHSTELNATYFNLKSSDGIKEFDLSGLYHTQCNDILSNYYFKYRGDRSYRLEESNLCAINAQNRSESCSLDYGAPLMAKGSSGRWYLKGVSVGSWAKCYETEYTASVYAQIYHYKDTIQALAPNATWSLIV